MTRRRKSRNNSVLGTLLIIFGVIGGGTLAVCGGGYALIQYANKELRGSERREEERTIPAEKARPSAPLKAHTEHPWVQLTAAVSITQDGTRHALRYWKKGEQAVVHYKSSGNFLTHPSVTHARVYVILKNELGEEVPIHFDDYGEIEAEGSWEFEEYRTGPNGQRIPVTEGGLSSFTKNMEMYVVLEDRLDPKTPRIHKISNSLVIGRKVMTFAREWTVEEMAAIDKSVKEKVDPPLWASEKVAANRPGLMMHRPMFPMHMPGGPAPTAPRSPLDPAVSPLPALPAGPPLAQTGPPGGMGPPRGFSQPPGGMAPPTVPSPASPSSPTRTPATPTPAPSTVPAPAPAPAPQPAAGASAEALATAERSETYGAPGGWKYEFAQPKPLLGFTYRFGSWDRRPSLAAIRPLFNEDEQVAGFSERIVAKPGYAVGGVTIETSPYVSGIQVVFMKLDGDQLDPEDSYKSKWIRADKSKGKAQPPILSDGKRVIGVFGNNGAIVNTMGLLFD